MALRKKKEERLRRGCCRQDLNWASKFHGHTHTHTATAFWSPGLKPLLPPPPSLYYIHSSCCCWPVYPLCVYVNCWPIPATSVNPSFPSLLDGGKEKKKLLCLHCKQGATLSPFFSLFRRLPQGAPPGIISIETRSQWERERGSLSYRSLPARLPACVGVRTRRV